MSRRRTVWARFVGSPFGLTAAAEGDVVDILTPFRVQMGLAAGPAVGGPPGITIVRIRMDVFSASLTGGAIPFWVGIRKINRVDLDEASVGGTEGLEVSPNRDPHADWMAYHVCYPNHGADPTTGVPNAHTSHVDVRAMRKIDEVGDTLGLFVGKELSVAAATVFISTSVLVMLP